MTLEQYKHVCLLIAFDISVIDIEARSFTVNNNIFYTVQVKYNHLLINKQGNKSIDSLLQLGYNRLTVTLI